MLVLCVQLSERFNLVGIGSDRFQLVLYRIKQTRVAWNAHRHIQYYVKLRNMLCALTLRMGYRRVYQFPFCLIHLSGLRLFNKASNARTVKATGLYENDYRLDMFIGS
jgi:hypothetical protein